MKHIEVGGKVSFPLPALAAILFLSESAYRIGGGQVMNPYGANGWLECRSTCPDTTLLLYIVGVSAEDNA